MSRLLYLVIFLLITPLAAVTAQQPQPPAQRTISVGEVQVRTNLLNLDTSITQSFEQQAAVIKENEHLKKLLTEVTEKCGEPCKPPAEEKK